MAANRKSVAIASGQTVSAAVNLKGYRVEGLELPAAFTGTSISFQVSSDGATFQPHYDTANALVSMTVAQGRSYSLPASLAAWPYFKIVSGTAEGAARTLVVVAST